MYCDWNLKIIIKLCVNHDNFYTAWRSGFFFLIHVNENSATLWNFDGVVSLIPAGFTDKNWTAQSLEFPLISITRNPTDTLIDDISSCKGTAIVLKIPAF